MEMNGQRLEGRHVDHRSIISSSSMNDKGILIRMQEFLIYVSRVFPTGLYHS